MRIFTITTLAFLMGCGGQFNPEIGSMGTNETEDDSTEDPDETGSTGDSTGDGDTDTGDGDGDGDGTPDMGTEEPVAPGPGEPCDPLDTEYPCEGEMLGNVFVNYSCSPVVADKGPAPDFPNIWEFRCVRVQDIDQDGTDPGDYCGANEWDTEGTWGTGCLNSFCRNKYENYGGAGQDVLPESLCGGAQDPELPGITQCCTSYCETNADCGTPDAKCLAVVLGGSTETPLDFGYCVDKDYQP